jgi:hypothetical protein
MYAAKPCGMEPESGSALDKTDDAGAFLDGSSQSLRKKGRVIFTQYLELILPEITRRTGSAVRLSKTRCYVTRNRSVCRARKKSDRLTCRFSGNRGGMLCSGPSGARFRAASRIHLSVVGLVNKRGRVGEAFQSGDICEVHFRATDLHPMRFQRLNRP